MFEKIAGYESLKQELATILGWYADPNLPQKAKLPRGVVLVGAPGTGKTLFLRSIHEISTLPVYIFEDNGKDDVIQQLQELFEKATEEPGGAIVVLDELDGLLHENYRLQRNLKEWMDGLVSHERVLVIASANSLGGIDDALLRPGRFDRVIRMSRPSKEERSQIIAFYLNAHNQTFSKEEMDYFCDLMSDCPPADIAAIIEDAWLRSKGQALTTEQIEFSHQLIHYQDLPEEKDSTERKKIICVHEIGHAVLIDRYRSDYSLHLISANSNCGRGGTCYIASADTAQHTLDYFTERVEIALGGYLATKIILGALDGGSAQDLLEARFNARRLVNTFGYCGAKHVLREYSRNERNESWVTCFFNERRATKILRRCEKRAAKYIKQNREKILQLAAELQQSGYLRARRVREVMKGEETQTQPMQEKVLA